VGVFRNARRRHILRSGLIQDEEWAWLLEQHPILEGLSDREQADLRGLVTLFIHEKRFEAAEGMRLQEYMKAVIAVQACLPVLNLGLDWYSNWRTVVVVPEEFTQEQREIDGAGVVHEWEEEHLGESWDRGPVVVSWEDVEASGWADGFNVIIHEAAHRLDLLDGAVNGRPALHPEMDPEQWRRVFTAAYEELRERVRRRRRSPVDPYAAESPGEFFAVVSELFFERPHALRGVYPQVYGLLSQLYRQDPGRRLPG
jgi:Mlc titration factor MtfA (ptsG expression regulator)